VTIQRTTFAAISVASNFYPPLAVPNMMESQKPLWFKHSTTGPAHERALVKKMG